MRIPSLLFLMALFALPAAAAPRADELALRRREVDVRVDENTARATLSWTVANPGLRPLEGSVVFRAPKGATVTGATILKHIGSADRSSKLLEAAKASALYDAIQRRDLKDEDLQEIAELQAMLKTAGGLVQDTRPKEVPSWHESWRRTAHSPGAFGLSNARTDPALVEQVADDTYRLRFFPVPPNDDQTVTVTMEFEAAPEGAARAVRIPLVFKDNFSAGPATEYRVKVGLRSSSPVDFAGSTTHALEAAKGRDLSVSAREDGRAADLAFRYRLAPDARLRVLEEGGGVTRTASLLIIDSSDRKQAERSGAVPAPAPPGPEDLKKCGFVRVGASGCGEHAVVTNDAVRLQWAKEQGLVPRPCTHRTAFGSEKAFAFDYVAHAAGCPVRESDPAKLKALAASVK